MARDQKIYETNRYGGGVLVDRTTELPVGFTARGVDQYMVVPVTDPLTGGIGFQTGAASAIMGENFLTKTCGDVVGGSGVLNGQLTDTGQVWSVSGAGYLTTVINGDHIEGTQNTYCNVNTGAKISKAVQYYSGAMATVEIGLDANLTDMIHANFTSSGGAVVTYWKSGVGTSLSPKLYLPVAACPNLNDGLPHKLELHVSGYFAFTYADGVLTSISYDANFPSITGNWFFAQIHGAGEKIYGVESYSSTATVEAYKPSAEFELISVASALFRGLIVGVPGATGFDPISNSYFWTDDADGHVFGSNAFTVVRAKSASPGYGAAVAAMSSIGTEISLYSENDGVGSIVHGGAYKVKFPYNVNRADWQVPTTLPTYTVALLPSAAVAYQKVFVSDATTPAFGATVVGGGAVKVPVYSDGTNWKVG